MINQTNEEMHILHKVRDFHMNHTSDRVIAPCGHMPRLIPPPSQILTLHGIGMKNK